MVRHLEHAARLHSTVTRARSLVGEDCLRREDHSYTLATPSQLVDAIRFEREVLNARERLATDPGTAVAEAAHALDGWRGTPYGDLAGDDPFRLEAIRLTELRDAAVETVAAGALASGMDERAILAARELVSRLPYRDRSWELLVEALWKAGRRIEAMDAIECCAGVMNDAGFGLPHALAAFSERVRRG